MYTAKQIQRPNQPKPKRSVKKIILIGLAVIFFLVAATATGALLWYNSSVNSTIGTADDTYIIDIEEGDTLSTITPKLQTAGIVTSELAYKIFLTLEKPQVALLVGRYTLTGGQDLAAILEEINEGPDITTITVTLPEGERYDEMADKLQSKFKSIQSPLFKRSDYIKIARNPDQITFSPDVQEFLDLYKHRGKSLEGFLFPDTYIIAADANAQDIIELQVRTLIRRLEEQGLSASTESRLKNFYEVLTLATIIEREANNYKDMQIVADIFIRRMKIGEPLGADATSLYPKKDWSYQLTRADLDNPNDPYNTRINKGLPPTPISSPGINAIKAVFNPRPNNYFFFVSAGGKNYYGKTLSEHCVNISKYLGKSC